MEATGTIGPYRIGLNYTVRDNTEFVTAHYFYVSHLTNIPLTGSVHGQDVEMQGADGSTFHLHFVGNATSGKQSLTFYNSIGLTGSWSQGGKTLPVMLNLGYSTENPGTRLYAQVTDQPDASFEAMVAGIRQAILDGNVAEVAKHTTFPLRVHVAHGSLTIRSAEQLKADWSKVFTPALLARLRKDVPHEMFVHEGAAMLGDGEVWFDAHGLMSVNQI